MLHNLVTKGGPAQVGPRRITAPPTAKAAPASSKPATVAAPKQPSFAASAAFAAEVKRSIEESSARARRENAILTASIPFPAELRLFRDARELGPHEIKDEIQRVRNWLQSAEAARTKGAQMTAERREAVESARSYMRYLKDAGGLYAVNW